MRMCILVWAFWACPRRAARAAALASAVLVTTKFYQINKLAGYLLYPYVGFLIFANALNISIATKNKNARARSRPRCRARAGAPRSMRSAHAACMTRAHCHMVC